MVLEMGMGMGMEKTRHTRVAKNGWWRYDAAVLRGGAELDGG